MIEGLTLCSSGGTYFWNDDLYYRHVLPKIKENLSEIELFLISKWDDKFSKHNQKLYHSNIKEISINYSDDGSCSIKISLYSYRLSMSIDFYQVSNFRFFQDDDVILFNEIFSVYIIEKYVKESWNIIKNKRFYFVSSLNPVEKRAFNFIEYESLKIRNLMIHDVTITENGVITQKST